MKRLALVLCGVVLIALAAVSAASATNPHFLSAKAAVDNGGNLLCSFKEAGLGDVPTVSISCTADATAVYACINGGNNHPKAANKETVNGPVSGSGEFPVRNGQTTGEITVGPPGAGDFACPNGQRLVLASVCYANVTLTGLNGDSALAEPN